MRTLFFVAALCAMLGGCGQKGPLFIPDSGATPAPAKTQPQMPTQTQPQTAVNHP